MNVRFVLILDLRVLELSDDFVMPRETFPGSSFVMRWMPICAGRKCSPGELLGVLSLIEARVSPMNPFDLGRSCGRCGPNRQESRRLLCAPIPLSNPRHPYFQDVSQFGDLRDFLSKSPTSVTRIACFTSSNVQCAT